MRNSDDVFDSLSGSFFKYLIDSEDDKNKSAQTRLMLVAIAILAFVGVEAVKVVFRKNFGSKGLSLFRVILSAVAFILLAWLALEMMADPDAAEVGTQASFKYAAGFYVLFALYILVKGIIEKVKPNSSVHAQYRGDSILLGFLMKAGWSQAKVQNLAEPLFTFAIGLFLSAVNPIWGLPIVFCAISVWLHLIMEAVFGISQVRDVLAEKGYQASQKSQFNEVTN